MAIVAPDGVERARSSRRRSSDDVVDDGAIAAEGCDCSRDKPEKVSSVFYEIVKKTHPNSFQEREPAMTRESPALAQLPPATPTREDGEPPRRASSGAIHFVARNANTPPATAPRGKPTPQPFSPTASPKYAPA